MNPIALNCWLPEHSPHGRFATEYLPQRRFATQRVRHTNVTENLSVTIGQTFATVPMRKIRHTTVIGWGWVGRVGIRGVGELGSGGLGRIGNPPTPIPQPNTPDLNPFDPNPNSIDPNPPTSTP